MAERFVNREQLAEILGVSRQRVRTLESQGKLPPPDAMLADRPLWRHETAMQWAVERNNGRDQEQERMGLKADSPSVEPDWTTEPQSE